MHSLQLEKYDFSFSFYSQLGFSAINPNMEEEKDFFTAQKNFSFYAALMSPSSDISWAGFQVKFTELYIAFCGSFRSDWLTLCEQDACKWDVR